LLGPKAILIAEPRDVTMKWLVVAVVVYTAVAMLRSAVRDG